MATLYLWNSFSKRENSTLRPSGTADASVSIDILTVENLKNPRFLLSASYLTNNYTYALFEGRYYFLDEPIIINGDMIGLDGTMDLMGTFKSEIGALSAYIEYAADSNNKMTPDNRLSMTDDILTNITTSNISPVGSGTSGNFIVAVAGDVTAATGGYANYWMLNESQRNALSTQLWLDANNWTTPAAQWFAGEPVKAIFDAFWTPFEIMPNLTPTNIHLGTTDIGVTGTPLGNWFPDKTQASGAITRATLTIPWTYTTNGNDWRNYEPYSVMSIYLPLYGTVSIDQSKLEGYTSLVVEMAKDVLGGELVYTVKTSDLKYIEKYSCNVNAQLAITSQKSQVLSGLGKMGAGIISEIAGGLTGNLALFGAGLAGVAAGVATVFRKQASGQGGNGAMGNAINLLYSDTTDDIRDVCLIMHTHVLTSDPSSVASTIGIPYFQQSTIGNHAGYIKCANASIICAASEEERRIINSHLNGGFYYE